MSRITDTITWDKLDNGIFTPSKDVIIADSVALSNPTIKYLPINHESESTAKYGSGCYRQLYFPIKFDGPLTIAYSTYNSTRSDVSNIGKDNEEAKLEYAKVHNKTSVIDDMVRENISFNQLSDIEPLLAKYILLQQFTGKRLVSPYVLNRLMDEYFTKYWDQISVSMETGYIEPRIPWLRMGAATGDKLEVDGNTLTVVVDGAKYILDPVSDVIDIAYATLVSKIKDLTPATTMQYIVDTINRNYNGANRNTDITRNRDFYVNDDTLSLNVDGMLIELNWKNTADELLGASERVLNETSDVSDIINNEMAYEALQELIDTTLTNGDTLLSYEIDELNGHTLTIGSNQIQFLGTKDLDDVDDILVNINDYMVDTKYASAIARVRNLSVITDKFVNNLVLNHHGHNNSTMLDYLES